MYFIVVVGRRTRARSVYAGSRHHAPSIKVSAHTAPMDIACLQRRKRPRIPRRKGGRLSSHQQKMAAIFSTLRRSIETELNASLTPDDCRELLRMFAMQRMRATIQNTQAPAPAPRSPVEMIVEGVSDIAHNVLNDLAADFKTAGVPARTRRRRK